MRGAPDRPVVVTGAGKTFDTQTNKDGDWHVKVPAGKKFTVRLPGSDGASFPKSRKVTANGPISDLDFTLCKLPDNLPQHIGCDLVKVQGKLVDTDGVKYGDSGAVPQGPGDSALVYSEGEFELFLPRGQSKITVTQEARAGGPMSPPVIELPIQIAAGPFQVSHDVNSVRLTVKPTIDFDNDVEPKLIAFGLAGIPESAPKELTVTLTPTFSDAPASCRSADIVGVVREGVEGQSLNRAFAEVLQPHPYKKFCSGRYTLTVSANPTPGVTKVVASAKLAIS